MSAGFGLALAETLLATIEQAPLILGPVLFSGHEVPARIKVGGQHTVSIHRLPGGGRIIDAMGPDEGAISWTGYFTGPAATARARVVDAIRQNGEPVGLSFGDYAFNVVVIHFDYDIQDRGAVISYRIRAEILPSATSLVDNTAGSIAASISNDLLTAISVLPGGAAGSSFSQAQVLMAGAAAPTSTQTLALVGVAMSAGGSALQGAMSVTGAGLVTGGGTFGTGITPPPSLNGLAQDAGSLASMTQSAGYVNRSQSSLNQLAGLPQSDPLIFA
nr:hypothetical protein [uncultured Lichenicoccus sp.]